MYGHTIDFFFAFVKEKVGDYEPESVGLQYMCYTLKT